MNRSSKYLAHFLIRFSVHLIAMWVRFAPPKWDAPYSKTSTIVNGHLMRCVLSFRIQNFNILDFKKFLFSSFSTKLHQFIHARRFRVLFLPRNCCGIYKLWKSKCFFFADYLTSGFLHAYCIFYDGFFCFRRGARLRTAQSTVLLVVTLVRVKYNVFNGYCNEMGFLILLKFEFSSVSSKLVQWFVVRRTYLCQKSYIFSMLS